MVLSCEAYQFWLIRSVYCLLTHQDTYRDLSLLAQEERLRARAQQCTVLQLRQLGDEATLTPLAPAT
jgi:hypothetical protein